MHLLLIRHGESVDNVAGLYAGTRDSPLTAHGVLQAKRLGAHIAMRRTDIGPVKQIFTSNLQRAYQTAEAVAAAQQPAPSDDASASEPFPRPIQLPELREKDFGLSEGKKFGTKEQSSDDGSETHESMRTRINRFLDDHLCPILDLYAVDKVTVVIVAHGIILNVLWKALLARYPVTLSNQVASAEFSVAWSNTGVLQARLGRNDSVMTQQPAIPELPRVLSPNGLEGQCSSTKPGLFLTLELANNVDHLQGLKKTRGGIGSAKFDSRQRTMDSFFTPTSKRRKLGESDE
ncbi:phosphoglycerate mutase-like protein [Xylariaceae sp. FL0804]|nr:phosphoglycerate mutase-like protein [Xylariaceae sp. FL0804]